MLSSPVILFPVSYCSTDFLRLEGSSITLNNSYSYSALRSEDEEARFTGRLQWFNTCSVEMENLVISHSSGRWFCSKQDNTSAFMSINWPSGPTAALNAPKWKVECHIEEIFLSLHKEDYALIQHVIQWNFGEESRHLEEWNVLQNLPPLVLKRYKEDIMVYFGYDKKDVAPTTFDVEVTLPALRFRIVLGGNDVAVVCCQAVSWKYKKSRDLISRQEFTSDVEIADANSPRVLLLSSQHRKSLTESLLSDLTYTSTTLACGDTTRTIQIVDSQIEFVYPSWNKLSRFFTGLPEAAFLSPSEVIQVGDRWYRIGSKSAATPDVTAHHAGWLTTLDSRWQTPARALAMESSPKFRFYFTLRRPRLAIGSESCSLLLLADEVLFIHGFKNPLIEREFTVTGVRIQATRGVRSPLVTKSFFTGPWSLRGELRQCNGSCLCNCVAHTVAVFAEMLEASVAFSDLTAVVETGLRVARDIGAYTKEDLPLERTSTQSKINIPSQLPRMKTVSLRWDGFAVAVVDDSGRHFATSQEIIVVQLETLDFCREEMWDATDNLMPITLLSPLSPISCMTRLRFATLDISDSLQCTSSPFRTILTVRASYASLPEDFSDICADKMPKYGVELSSDFSTSREYLAKIGSVDIQYNPSLVVALQRFLGRTSKDMKAQLTALFKYPALKAASPTITTTQADSDADVRRNEVVQGKLSLTHLRICLNKEHQGRQLIEALFSDGSIKFRKSRECLNVSGHLAVVDAIYNTSERIVRNVLKVGGDSDENFLSFQYLKFHECQLGSPSTSLQLPDWVCNHIVENQGIDDCLSVSVASLDGVYDKELTMEIIDYLSNGMPGKGMGLTSIAAQGFVTKRILTKSFLQVHVDSPRLFIPRDLLSDRGIACSFGTYN